ncbi:MAG: 30S ribosomal protein S17 [Dehalococcoidia bacterium]|nr:30S ribosomal protein S17 [Dehalococcoidia bacterium]
MGNRRTLVGNVVSNKMDKTVVVLISTRRQHVRYKKHVVYNKKLKAHDETNACSVGDRVKISETRPLSKEKCWRVAEILTKAETREPSIKEEAS